MEPGVVVLLVVLGFLLLTLLILGSHVRNVSQSEKFVIERLGRYKTTWEPGIHILMPFVDKIEKKINFKEQVVDFDPQPVITKDNVTMQIDTVVFYQITDAKLFTYGVNQPIKAIENLTATTLRNIIGDLELDESLTSRDLINSKMRAILDEATDPWGIKINRVELKNIMPPKDIRDAMEKQMRAERQKRAAILKAEGEKEATILEAEALKASTILKAEAEKESKIKYAEGEAISIIKVQEANARGIDLIKTAGADKAYLALKSFEALEKVADGKATKIIIPSELQNVSGLVASLSEIIKTEK